MRQITITQFNFEPDLKTFVGQVMAVIDQTMIANAESTGMPVNLSPKYWAEHRGMPYPGHGPRQRSLDPGR